MVLFSTGVFQEKGGLHCLVNDEQCVLEGNSDLLNDLDVHVYPEYGDKLAGKVACYTLARVQDGLQDHSNSHQFVDGG